MNALTVLPRTVATAVKKGCDGEVDEEGESDASGEAKAFPDDVNSKSTSASSSDSAMTSSTLQSMAASTTFLGMLLRSESGIVLAGK